MQVIYVINIILMFCMTGVLLHHFYDINDDKVVEFDLLDNVKFVKNSSYFSRDSKQKIKLLPIDDGSISVIDLQDWYYRLLEQEDSLKNKEILLRTVEQHNNEQVLYLEEIQRKLVSLINIDDQNYDEKVHSLVKIYESMPVKLAAEVFGLLDTNSLMLITNYIDKSALSDILLHVDPNMIRKIKELSTDISKQCDCNSDIIKSRG
ncbi:hypothetical protein EHF_0818 [Ehrlichia japonica]|uniref:MgtE intracellular N domain protein n=2 Tax=Ehrlichia japonica TaxID=391036 RepID=X5GC24_9RICK|nr:hypothetical protein EHF_0818 [Ehrlichia japonica]